jgi:ABC-type uncharacterized transport system permease subunit
MKKELNYLASKRWVKVGRQELRSTPYKQEIHPHIILRLVHNVFSECFLSTLFALQTTWVDTNFKNLLSLSFVSRLPSRTLIILIFNQRRPALAFKNLG